MAAARYTRDQFAAAMAASKMSEEATSGHPCTVHPDTCARRPAHPDAADICIDGTTPEPVQPSDGTRIRFHHFQSPEKRANRLGFRGAGVEWDMRQKVARLPLDD